MIKTLAFFFVILLSTDLFSKVLLPEDESRTLDEAQTVVEKSQRDRKEYDENATKREMASEKKSDPKFEKAFNKLMDDLDQK